MRKVIDGGLYDTDTATVLGQWDNGRGVGDFSALEETLYRTPKGHWFLVGRGGAATGYARSTGLNTWTGGSRLVPLSLLEAQQWLECHGDVETLLAFFDVEVL
jgi:hypothetical protein